MRRRWKPSFLSGPLKWQTGRGIAALERVEGKVMSVFGVEGEEERAQAGVEHGGQGSGVRGRGLV